MKDDYPEWGKINKYVTKKKCLQPITPLEIYNLINETPNDTDLGKLIREKYGNTK